MPKALIEPAAALPVNLDEVKAHLRVETADEDLYLTSLLTAAVNHVETGTGCALISQFWRVYLDCWPRDSVAELPLFPVRSVEGMTVFDENGVGSALDASHWQIDAVSRPARLFLKNVPAPGLAANGIEIDIEAGFGETGTDVPDTIKRAIPVLVAHWHELRGAAADAVSLGLEPAGYSRLIAPFKRIKL